eukprot:2588335-Alexandrium_andersonii.AAC.1
MLSGSGWPRLMALSLRTRRQLHVHSPLPWHRSRGPSQKPPPEFTPQPSFPEAFVRWPPWLPSDQG